jgi:hypothetical protein
MKCEPIWYELPEAVGGVDLALEGDDACKFCKGLFGRASGVKMPPSLQHPNGETIWFLDRNGHKSPRHLALVEKIFPLPKGDTVAMAEEVMRLARSLKIKPEYLALDKTGNGQGVFDLIRRSWPLVIGVNFFESATESRLFAEDHETCKELYDRMQSELWFAVRRWLEFKYLMCAFSLETSDLLPQLTDRLFRGLGKKSKVESKTEYKSRHGGKSPDDADAFTLFLLACRRGSGFTPGMNVENSTEASGDDDWDPNGGGRPGGCDPSNRFEDLDSAYAGGDGDL